MSTKIPLKAGEDHENRAGFELYADCIDEMAGINLIYLDLVGVSFEPPLHPQSKDRRQTMQNSTRRDSADAYVE